ncbi:FKBP-type peptidyl-prolyl cis-trans isomerase [uncultured Nitrospira sp.]|uniref:FKBP-type peptidyl-prolyl cis-trans isomerase n=1 Tax=uncultured Nitrospira sp. TaxID=157176 RepID=UPI0031404C99
MKNGMTLPSGLRLPVFIIGSWIILLIIFVLNPLSGKAAEESMVTTPSGLQYVDLARGSGREAHAGETAIVHYTGTLTDGTKFDSSKDRNSPFSFRLGAGSVIKGWDEGVEGMNIGGIRKLIIPPQLGYGSRGAGSAVPPNATLIFEVELLDLR